MDVPSALSAAITVCSSPSLGRTVLFRSSLESSNCTAFSYMAMSKVITVGCSSPTTKLFNWDACRISQHCRPLVFNFWCATSGSSGSAPTWVKDWPDDTSDLNPAQPGILLCSPLSFSQDRADAMIGGQLIRLSKPCGVDLKLLCSLDQARFWFATWLDGYMIWGN